MMVMKAVQQLLFDVDWRAGSPGGNDLDVLVIDTPPGTGDVTLSLGQLVEVDGELSQLCIFGAFSSSQTNIFSSRIRHRLDAAERRSH
jgi:Mrp family chromosome partitioning ATPase